MAKVPGLPEATFTTISPDNRLINGYEIMVASETLPVAAGQDIAFLAPVMFDAEQNLVEAAYGTPACGIALFPITTDTETASVQVMVAGVVNPDAIAWPASYDTVAKRAGAFRGAPAPTNFIVKANV